MRRNVAGIFVLAFLCFAGCEDCDSNSRNGPVPRCGKCAHSAECTASLRCLNGVCETAPPSCHVEIGL